MEAQEPKGCAGGMPQTHPPPAQAVLRERQELGSISLVAGSHGEWKWGACLYLAGGCQGPHPPEPRPRD